MRSWVVWSGIVVAALHAAPASGSPGSPGKGKAAPGSRALPAPPAVPAIERTPPWAVGVSDQQKAAAQQRLDAGNEFLLARKYAEAIEQYRQAVAAWDHPAIRFNIVRCLIQLEKPVEAAEELKRALVHGAAPFDETIYNEALSYEKLLAKQVGDLEIRCGQAGVVLTLDGQPLLTCPGAQARRVLPGQHQVVGKKDGYLPRTVEVVVLGGDREQVGIELAPLGQGARVEHRWSQWVPWTVFASGFVVGGLGGLLHLEAVSDLEAFEKVLARACPDGCMPGQVDRSLESRANIVNSFAVGAIAVGAAAVVGGSAMLYLNRGRTVYDAERPTPRSARVDVVPIRGGGAAVSLSARF